MTRDGADQEQQVPVGVDLHDPDVARGDPLVALAAGHLQALDHPARIAVRADRAAVAEELVGAVALGVDGEVVPLDHAGRAHALAGTDHVHALAGAEDVAAHVLTDLVLRGIFVRDPALLQVADRRQLRLREVALHRLRHVLGSAGQEAELEGGVAVLLGSLLLDHGVGARLEHGHGVARAGLIVETGHADLAAEKLDGHGLDPRTGVGTGLGDRVRIRGPHYRRTSW